MNNILAKKGIFFDSDKCIYAVYYTYPYYGVTIKLHSVAFLLHTDTHIHNEMPCIGECQNSNWFIYNDMMVLDLTLPGNESIWFVPVDRRDNCNVVVMISTVTLFSNAKSRVCSNVRAAVPDPIWESSRYAKEGSAHTTPKPKKG